jgi:hypothetical protein
LGWLSDSCPCIYLFAILHYQSAYVEPSLHPSGIKPT